MLKDLLSEFFSSNKDACEDLFDGMTNNKLTSFLLKNDINEDFVKEHGGSEQGIEFYTVYKYTKGKEEIYIKFDGSYSSYEGSEYESFYFVKPHEKTIIEYY